MTKKHFIALADALKAQKPAPHWDANKWTQWRLDVKAVTDVCAEQGAKFNRSKFLSYIGDTEGN